VNGPKILSKFVGASEENSQKLSAEAEKEYKEKGDESGLHIIIFDKLDALFKQCRSMNNGTGIGDTIVNQLLSKVNCTTFPNYLWAYRFPYMDGVDQLNNILIIGMTNCLDMIDEVLLHSGCLEVHMKILLPDEHSRYQILNIHTSKMQTSGLIDNDVNLVELASLTKNFSGAEIGGLIKSATSYKGWYNSDDVENLRVNRTDFIRALDKVHSAFSVSEEKLQQVIQNSIIHYDIIVKVSTIDAISLFLIDTLPGTLEIWGAIC
jgi:vesicle-fusing ATPase